MQLSNKAPFPANDGSSIAIYNMAQGLIENNVKLNLLTINTKKHFKPDSQVPSAFKENSNYSSVYKNTNTSALLIVVVSVGAVSPVNSYTEFQVKVLEPVPS